MSDVTFRMGPIGDDSQVVDMMARYRREMVRRKMPSTWPESDLYHYAVLFYEDEPMSMLVYAPINAHRKIYSVGAYTRPSWRRLGLYGFIWGLCVNTWRKADTFDFFQSGYHKNNLISHTMQESQGREPVEENGDYMRTRYSLRSTGEEFEMTSEHLKPMSDLFQRLSG